MGARAGNICRQRLPGTHQIGCRHLGIGTKARRARRHGPICKSRVPPFTTARCVVAAPFAAGAPGSSRTVYTPSKLPRSPGSPVSPLTLEKRGSRSIFLGTHTPSPANPTQRRRKQHEVMRTRIFAMLPHLSRPRSRGHPGLFTRPRNSGED